MAGEVVIDGHGGTSRAFHERERTPMQPALRPWHAVLRLNTDLALNCLDGLTDEEASRRVSPRVNSVAFLLAHLTDMRYFGATLLGRPGTNPLSLVLDGARGIDEVKVLPPLAGPTLLGMIAFLMQHESYHVGQLRLPHTQLGHPAMTYARRPE
jgi:hypothetical protein